MLPPKGNEKWVFQMFLRLFEFGNAGRFPVLVAWSSESTGRDRDRGRDGV